MAHDQFTEIAGHYDDLMAGVPYRYWAEYIEDILARIPYRPRTILDAACGTGNVSEILMEFGYEVTGIDISPGMIDVAKGKTGKYGDVEYLVQDMTKLDLGRQFDVVISLFDSLNYITEPVQLQTAMKRIASHLVPGGIFIFDVNTEYALSHGFFNQANLDSRHYPKYVWSAEYDKSRRVCTVTMVFEVPDGDATRQFTEVHRQYAYKLEELEVMIEKAGLEFVDSYFAYTFKKPSRRSDRVFFVARKPGEES
jgi:SAM-dependent methyltransferase